MAPEIEIYDTTLRDGSQGQGVSFSVADKLKIAERLDAFGVHYIEGGWPGSNPKDVRFFQQMQGVTLKNAKLASFGVVRVEAFGQPFDTARHEAVATTSVDAEREGFVVAVMKEGYAIGDEVLRPASVVVGRA